MIIFAIKSAICLAVLYGFYHTILRNTAVSGFNRYYLLFSLLFSLIIPLITVHINLKFPSNLNIFGFSTVTGNLNLGERIITEPIHNFKNQNVLISFFLFVSSILFVRFASNIYKIVKLIRTNPKINFINTQIVLIERKTLPYSFFRYIFVNRYDYENNKIAKEILNHEQVHCLQYHSIDIALVELIQIILWFNPFVLLFRKAIQLQHEYLADKRVLITHNLTDYQNTLLNLVLQNKSTYLVSKINYSLTKKRLTMMTKSNFNNRPILRKIAVFPIYLILAVTLCLAQEGSMKEQKEIFNTYGLTFTNEQKAAREEQKGFISNWTC